MMRALLAPNGILTARELMRQQDGARVGTAGLVICRQRPGTAKGFVFLTLEDETGIANLIVWQNVWERYRRVAFAADLLMAHGPVQHEGDVIHVIVSKLEDLSPKLAEFQARSRDFR